MSRKQQVLPKRLPGGDMLGIDEVVIAQDFSFDKLLEALSQHQYIPYCPIQVIGKGKQIH